MASLPPPHRLSPRELADELRRLISYGLSEHGLAKRPLILNLPNVRQRAQQLRNEEHPGTPHEPTKRELALAADALIRDGVRTFDRDEPHKANAYRLLLILSEEASRITTAEERRRRAISLLGLRLEPVSWRTGPHELDYLEELARNVLALPPEGITDPPLPPMFLARERTSPMTEISREELQGESGEAIKIEYGPDPREKYTQLSVRMLCLFDSGRIPSHETIERIIMANENNLSHWWEAVNYTVSNDVVELRPIHGTAVVRRRLPGNFHGSTYYELEFPRVLNQGEVHTLRVEKVIRDRRSEPLPYFVYHARRPRSLITMQVLFAADSLPRKVYRIVTPTHRLPETTIARRLVPLNPDGSVDSPFTDLVEGVSYGFLWSW